MEQTAHRLTYASLFILALATFTSVSLNAGSHVLIFIPGLYFFARFFQEKTSYDKKSYFALLALFLVCIISIFPNFDVLEAPLKNIIKTKYFLIPLLSVPAFYFFFRDYVTTKSLKILLNLFIISTTIASLSGIIGLYTGFNPLKFKAACHAERACGLFGMYMTYAYGVSMFLSLLSGLILFKDRVSHLVNKNLLYIAWIINFAGLYLSYTRGALIGFLVSLPFLFFAKNKSLFLKVSLLSIIVFGASFLSPKVRDMFFNRERSNSDRVAFYMASVEAFKERPLLGFGYKNFESHVKAIKVRHNLPHQERGGHAHNNLLEHLASTGALGFLATIAFFIIWLISTSTSPIFMPFVVNFIISGMVQYTFGDGENLFLIMNIWALSVLPYSLWKKFIP